MGAWEAVSAEGAGLASFAEEQQALAGNSRGRWGAPQSGVYLLVCKAVAGKTLGSIFLPAEANWGLKFRKTTRESLLSHFRAAG